MKRTILRSVFIITIAAHVSCATCKPAPAHETGPAVSASDKVACPLDPASVDTSDITPEQAELDVFFSYMAYAVIYKNWQRNSDIDKSRGYNIGSILVDDKHNVVNWARNSVNCRKNGSQHGEVRLMQSYLDAQASESSQTTSLPNGFTVYTTLEPCAQCSGMMKLLKLNRTVYGQTDPAFGKALERLQQKTSDGCTNGYDPYPRPVISDKSPDTISIDIDKAYGEKMSEMSITQFLATEDARVLFEEAEKRFLSMTSEYPKSDNKPIMAAARKYYTTVPDKPADPSPACQAF